MKFAEVGALVFGIVVGAITYRTLVRTVDKTAVGDLTSVLAAIGGGVVTSLYGADANSFAWYAIGLAIGIVSYFLVFWKFNGSKATAAVMGEDTIISGGAATGAEPTSGPKA